MPTEKVTTMQEQQGFQVVLVSSQHIERSIDMVKVVVVGTYV
jgi:hypothetical protein